MVGREARGSLLDCPLDADWWWPAAVRDHSLFQFVYNLYGGRFELPGALRAGYAVPTRPAGGSFGISHRNIADGGVRRAPFTRRPFDETAVYPVLANNGAKEQTRMLFRPDCMAVPKPGAGRAREEGGRHGHAPACQLRVRLRQPGGAFPVHGRADPGVRRVPLVRGAAGARNGDGRVGRQHAGRALSGRTRASSSRAAGNRAGNRWSAWRCWTRAGSKRPPSRNSAGYSTGAAAGSFCP